MSAARHERLKSELAESELELDRLGRTLKPGMMRTQQRLAGQRAKVFGLRLEVRTIDLATSTPAEQKRDVMAEIAGYRLGIKEAEASARAASKQATEDIVPELLRRLEEANDLQGDFAKMH